MGGGRGSKGKGEQGHWDDEEALNQDVEYRCEWGGARTNYNIACNKMANRLLFMSFMPSDGPGRPRTR